jgi:DNA-binding HxlR family transcriptional regulator
MGKRSYAQYCALAKAFDVIGERWTPLLLRELALGPRRYADLFEGLPGIGTALLAARLRDLEAAGVVQQRRLPAPAARNVYELTASGRELAEALIPLARWGAKRMGQPLPGEEFRLEWFLLYMRSVADPTASAGLHDMYEFHVDDEVFHVTAEDGAIDARNGPAPRHPDVVVTTDLATFMLLGTGGLSLTDPEVVEKMQLEGDPDAAIRAARILVPPTV